MNNKLITADMNIDQLHDELRDRFNQDYRLLMANNYMRIMGGTIEEALVTVDNVLLMANHGISNNYRDR